MPLPSKKRKIAASSSRIKPTAITEEVLFDLSARQEYLTGFHKRKVQRTKAAQDIAAKRARQEKLAQRKTLREERRKDLERHVKEVNDMIRPPELGNMGEESESESEGEGEGGSDSNGREVEELVVLEPVDHEAEYIDEDKYTSVVVEEMDVTREGLRKANEAEDDKDDVATKNPHVEATSESKPSKPKWTKEKPKDGLSKAKKKRKKFRYESKSERRVSRDKERSKNREQAKARRAK